MIDTILTIVSAVCTVISMIGAHKSIKYYKKSKQLTVYANTNVALVEVQKIIDTFTEILKLANTARSQRGTNLAKQLGTYGESIRASINVIRDKLSVEDFRVIENALVSREIKVEDYVDSFISGDILVDGKLTIDYKFQLCQKRFYSIQQIIKERVEKIEENLS